MSPPIIRIILYVKDIPKVAAFYQRHFGLQPAPGLEKGWLELRPAEGGCAIALHQASVAQKSGAAMKIVFAVPDVAAFRRKGIAAGVKFGPIHEADGFAFANAKDPAGNALQISSRGLAK
jgi:predicted enzyme related to lactoylglutathione lyase